MALPKTFSKLSKYCLIVTAIGAAGMIVNLFLNGGPARQSFTEIAQQPFFQSGFWLILLSGGLIGAGVFAVASSMAGKRLYRQIVENGRDAEARLVKVAEGKPCALNIFPAPTRSRSLARRVPRHAQRRGTYYENGHVVLVSHFRNGS